ncbi:hypothetical protein AVEN_81619-1, partial [Araneus ventricosus]
NTVYREVYDIQRRAIHDKIHTLPKFKSPPRDSLDGRRLSQQRTATSLDRVCWSRGRSSVAIAPQVARSHAMGFLPVGLCEGQSACTPNANNAASTAGRHLL